MAASLSRQSWNAVTLHVRLYTHDKGGGGGGGGGCTQADREERERTKNLCEASRLGSVKNLRTKLLTSQ